MINGIPTLADLGDVSGKRVFVRTDFNVPLDGSTITDDFRIRAALPTINWLTERGATVVCASHLGRPKGAPNPKYSMDPVRARLAELLAGDLSSIGPAVASPLLRSEDLWLAADGVAREKAVAIRWR